jgi:hypothetical protein
MRDSAGNGTTAGLSFSSLMEPASEMETNRDFKFNNAPIESKFPAYVLCDREEKMMLSSYDNAFYFVL